MSVLRRIFVGVLLLGLLVVGPAKFTTAQGAMLSCPVTLAWDASLDTVSGYALYYGLANSTVTNRMDVGSAQTVIVQNLFAGSSYFFFVVAYDASGMESVPSDVLLYRPPALSRLEMTSLTDGTLRLNFRGAPGAICAVEYASSLVSPQWRTLFTVTADLNGYVAIIDPLVGRPPARFYRAVRL